MHSFSLNLIVSLSLSGSQTTSRVFNDRPVRQRAPLPPLQGSLLACPLVPPFKLSSFQESVCPPLSLSPQSSFQAFKSPWAQTEPAHHSRLHLAHWARLISRQVGRRSCHLGARSRSSTRGSLNGQGSSRISSPLQRFVLSPPLQRSLSPPSSSKISSLLLVGPGTLESLKA